MDIITHTLSGVAIGTVLTSFSSNKFRNKFGLIAIAGLGGAFPDFDTISLWSKFDTTIGKLFALENSGKEIYFSKFWYSHHGFLHSLFASIIIALIFVILMYLIKSRFKELSVNNLIHSFKNNWLYLIGFVLAYTIHLLEDMPTPDCVWGGVNFFWPLKSYSGGTGDIWWWNNYDVFLIVVGVIILNTLFQVTNRFIRIDTRKVTTVILILGISISLFQIKTRDFDFNYTGHTPRYNELENKSKEIQKRILGDKLFQLMVKLDNKLPLNF